MLEIGEVVIQYKTLCFAHGLRGLYPTINFQMVYTCKMHNLGVDVRSNQNKKLYKHRTETSTGDRGIQSALELAWNNLPFDLRDKDEESTATFKTLIKKHLTASNQLTRTSPTIAALNHLPIKCRESRCIYDYCIFCIPKF